MRFKEFILSEEKTDLKTIVDLIKRDCQEYLSMVDKYPLLRGVRVMDGKKPTEAPLFKRNSIRMDRRPLSSSHDPFFNWMFDAIIEKEFNIKNIRKTGLFVSGSEGTANYYGSVVFIFPIGKFDFIWAKNVLDSYEEFTSLKREYNQYKEFNEKLVDFSYEDVQEYFENLMKHDIYDYDHLKYPRTSNKNLDMFIKTLHKHVYDTTIKDAGYVKNKNFNEALKRGREIIIPGPLDYYAIGLEKLITEFEMSSNDYATSVFKELLKLIND